jgi:hypothetical protein
LTPAVSRPVSRAPVPDSATHGRWYATAGRHARGTHRRIALAPDTD